MRSAVATLVTTPERRETRDATLRELARFDIQPLVILSTPTPENAKAAPSEADELEARGYQVQIVGRPDKGYGGRNNALGFRAAFRAAYDSGSDLLYCEDDLQLADDFAWFVSLARDARNAATWLYTHDHRKDADQARRYGVRTWHALKEAARLKQPFGPKGLYRMVDASRANSGQCFYLPWDVLNGLPLQELDRQPNPVDRWTQHRVVKHGFETLVALPHPVQHLVSRTGREPPKNDAARRAKTSMSFDLR